MDDHCGAGWRGISFLSPPHGLTTLACLGSQPFVKISRPLLASRVEQGGGGRGARGHLSLSGHVLRTAGLALLPAALAARGANLEKMQNTHLENIHSSSQLGERGSGPSRCGVDPLCLQPGSHRAGNTGTSQGPNPCPGQPPIYYNLPRLGLKFSEMPSKPLFSTLTLIFRLLSTIRLQPRPRWPIIIKL